MLEPKRTADDTNRVLDGGYTAEQASLTTSISTNGTRCKVSPEFLTFE